MKEKRKIFSRYSDNPMEQKSYEEWLVKYLNKKDKKIKYENRNKRQIIQ